MLASPKAAHQTDGGTAIAHVSEEGVKSLCDLPEEVLISIFDRVRNPLLPLTATSLACSCKATWHMPLLRKAVMELSAEHQRALTLVTKAGLTLDRLANASRLSWGKKDLSAGDAKTLASLARHIPRLEELDLRGNEIGDAGLLAFTNATGSGSFSALRVLGLSACGISTRGANRLALAVNQCPHPAFPLLEQLRMESNQIKKEGMASLAASISDGALPMLSSCYLTSNPADDAAVQLALSTRPGYLGGMLGSGQITCCREARRAGRGGRFF